MAGRLLAVTGGHRFDGDAFAAMLDAVCGELGWTWEHEEQPAALGVDSELAHSSIRFGLHRFSTEEEVDFVGRRVVEVVQRLREMSPLYELAKEGVDLKTIKWKAE